MPDDIAFKIQLGLILPKLKDKIAADMSAIIKTGTFVHSVQINSGNTYLQAMHVVPERSDTPQKLKTLF